MGAFLHLFCLDCVCVCVCAGAEEVAKLRPCSCDQSQGGLIDRQLWVAVWRRAEERAWPGHLHGKRPEEGSSVQGPLQPKAPQPVGLPGRSFVSLFLCSGFQSSLRDGRSWCCKIIQSFLGWHMFLYVCVYIQPLSRTCIQPEEPLPMMHRTLAQRHDLAVWIHVL